MENNNVPLDSFDLYNLLEPCGLSLAAYLVYAHLRAQAFRVRRHVPQRRHNLEKQLLNQSLQQQGQDTTLQSPSSSSESNDPRPTLSNDTDQTNKKTGPIEA